MPVRRRLALLVLPAALTGTTLVGAPAQAAGDGAPAPRSVDRAVCTSARGGESWSVVAARVRSSAVAVQRVSGGNPSPLQGQRACSRHLRP